MKFSTLITVCIAVAVNAWRSECDTSNWTVGQTVKTCSGSVTGHAATNDSTVSEYLGIPYAQAPVGLLRWAPPLPYFSNAIINGSSFGNSCPTKPGTPVTAAGLAAANVTEVGLETLAILSNVGTYSEDCLYVNVWTKPQTGEKKKAVMIWIYGGGFNSGSGSFPGYNGQNIAGQEDVVVVSFNYRLTILGFPGAPGISQNLGLLDQRLAVEWVRDNIAGFGGDPSRITLFGQSAGAASIDFYSYAWKSDPIASGFIAESGNVFGWGLPNSAAKGEAAWYTVTAALGCGNASSSEAAVLACMYQQNATDIIAAVPQAAGEGGILGLFGPTVDNKTVFADYYKLKPANIPLLIGNNNYEGGLFRTTFALVGIFFPDVWWTDLNLWAFTCPTGIRSNASLAAGVKTWRYRYFGIFPDLYISSEAGAWHAAEVPILFDTAPAIPGATADEISIAKYMRAAWAAFAKDPANGLTNYGWPTYNNSEDTLIRLAYDNITGPNLINPYAYDADCIFVNVTDVNTTWDPTLPDLGATVTPTGMADLTLETALGKRSAQS